MKKLMTLFLAAAAALSLAGCDRADTVGRDQNSLTDNSGSSSRITSIGGEPGGIDGEMIKTDDPDSGSGLRMLFSGSGGRMSHIIGMTSAERCTENGYYSIKQTDEKSSFLNLTYVDFASRREVVVCSDSSCKHNSELCASCFSYDDILSCHVFVNGEYVFLLSTEYDSDGSFSGSSDYIAPDETRRAGIYRMELDGTGREKIFEAEPGDVIEGNVFGDGGYLWFVVKTPSAEVSKKTGATYNHSKNRALIKLSVAEKKVVERIPLDDHNNIVLEIIGCTKDKFVLRGVAYPNGSSVMDNIDILASDAGFGKVDSGYLEFRKKCEWVYFTLDSRNKELKEIHRENQETKGSFVLFGDHLYFEREDHSMYRKSLLDGKAEELTVPGGYEFAGFYQSKAMFMANGEKNGNTYFSELEGLVFTAPKGSRFNIHSGLISDAFGGFRVLGSASDKLLIEYDIQPIPIPNKNSGYIGIRSKLGLVTFDDLYAGRDTVTPVTSLDDYSL